MLNKYANLKCGTIEKILDIVVGDGGIDALIDGRTQIVPLALSQIQRSDVWVTPAAWLVFGGELGRVCKTETLDLKKRMIDQEIIQEYGDDIVFDSTRDLEMTLANLISKQPDGKLGSLLTGKSVNLFYVRFSGEVRCVKVSWDSHGRLWKVDSDDLDLDWWDDRNRVFRNCGHTVNI